jgi:hypothetical protein
MTAEEQPNDKGTVPASCILSTAQVFGNHESLPDSAGRMPE